MESMFNLVLQHEDDILPAPPPSMTTSTATQKELFQFPGSNAASGSSFATQQQPPSSSVDVLANNLRHVSLQQQPPAIPGKVVSVEELEKRMNTTPSTVSLNGNRIKKKKKVMYIIHSFILRSIPEVHNRLQCFNT
jgi:hypothetical protein